MKNFFYCNDVHPVEGLRPTRARGLQIKMYSLCRYLDKIMVNPRQEQLKIVVIGKASSLESVLQIIGSSEESARVDHTSH